MLTKTDIVSRAAERGRPISVAIAGTISTLTGGTKATVEAALDAAQRAEADASITKVVADAVHAHQLAHLRTLEPDELTVVALSHFGVGSDLDILTELCDGAPDARAVLQGAIDAGVLTASTPLPGVGNAVRDTLGARRLGTTLTRLLEYRSKTDTLDESAAVVLAQAGVQHPHLATFLSGAGDSAPIESAALLYSCAVEAGADALLLAAKRAELAAVVGDLDTAELFCDSVLEQCDRVTAEDLRIAVRASATVAAERGMTERGRQLYAWLGAERAGTDAPLADAVAVVAGDPAPTSVATPKGPPTSASAAVSLLADGLRRSITAVSTAESAAATNTLMRAVSLSTGATRRASPENPAATAILFALHGGDLALAESTAARSATSGHHPSSVRIVLLQAWTSMLAGDLSAANTRIDSLRIPPSHSRNRLFLHALRVGLARRSGDTGSLLQAWDDAQDVIAEYSADLFSLLPIGELWLGAVRVDREERISHLVQQAESVVAGLGEPSAWSSAFHWYGVQAAILAEQPAHLVPHARALAAAAESNRYSAALAGAGRAWLAVLQGQPNVSDVESAAQSLAGFGLSWDGARLASEAALRVTDTRAATALLQVARSLRQPVAAPATVAEEVKGALSAREAEVAELLVLGVTYREVGSRLYISAKTVEHHVARIRRRLGAGSRSELLSMLRAMGYGAGA